MIVRPGDLESEDSQGLDFFRRSVMLQSILEKSEGRSSRLLTQPHPAGVLNPSSIASGFVSTHVASVIYIQPGTEVESAGVWGENHDRAYCRSSRDFEMNTCRDVCVVPTRAM